MVGLVPRRTALNDPTTQWAPRTKRENGGQTTLTNGEANLQLEIGKQFLVSGQRFLHSCAYFVYSSLMLLLED